MKTLVILTLLFVSSSAHAQTTARELAAYCHHDDTNGKEAANNMYCMGYVAGVVESAITNSEVQFTGQFTHGETRDAFIAHLRDHPENGGLTASEAILIALDEHHMIRFVSKPKEDKKPK